MSADKRFYKNEEILWRREGNGDILIYSRDVYYRINPEGALLFSLCEKINLPQLYAQLGSTGRKRFVPTIAAFFEKLLEENIIIPKEEIFSPDTESETLLSRTELLSQPPCITRVDLAHLDPQHFKRPDTPLRIFLTLTHRCNLRCRHCYNPPGANGEAVADFEKLKAVIDRIGDARVFEIIITGGEPFLYPHILSLIDYISSRGMAARVNTNGLLLEEDLIGELAKKKNLSVSVGIDGTHAAAHEFIRGETTFAPAIKILERLSRTGLDIYINFTATHRNVNELWKLKTFFKKFRVSQIIVNPFIRTGRGIGQGNILALTRWEQGLLKLFAATNNPHTTPQITVLASCYAGHIEANIDAQGRFFFCELLPSALGNIEKEGLKELWDSPSCLSLRDVDTFGAPCNRCFFRYRCYGSCRAETFAATGDLYAGNPFCFKGKFFPLRRRNPL